ncbi:hypothetical protein [Janibacter melonis]|uniref:hypothetical protein n=1 Tax=Janibacter melonis TaxID=262209 RepID=UPI00177CCCE4|nr:hypothetical protein [Janibacter melonis]
MSILEAKIAVNQVALVVIAAIIAVAFTAGAVSTGTWAWLVAVPMDVAGAVLVVVGGARRRASDNERGTATSVLGGLLVVGSIWAAFGLGNAVSSEQGRAADEDSSHAGPVSARMSP